MQNKFKNVYRLVMIIAALCGIVDLLFKLQNIPPQDVSQNVSNEEKMSVDGVEFLELIDFYDKQISELAADVNDLLNRNANYRNAGYLLERT